MNDIVGLRFDPTEIQIIDHYLRLKMLGDDYQVWAINEVNVCKYEPWDLCELSEFKSDSMWHFFCRRKFKYASGERVNRTTDAGYWKKTGRDRKIRKGIAKQVIGTKKILVFHTGRSPQGMRTNWVMHEYHSSFVPPDKRSFVLCRLEKKEGQVNDGTPCVEHEPSGHAPSGNRNCVLDDTVSAPEVTGNTFQQTLVSENGNLVVNNTVSAPEEMRNASQQTHFTENGNFVVENTVSSPEFCDIEEYLNFMSVEPPELLVLDAILSPAHEFQVQETMASDDIPAKKFLANNIEGALFNSRGNNEGSPATKKGVNHSGDSPRFYSVAAASPAKKNVCMQQKSSSKDAKKGSRTASPAKKNVCMQQKSSSKDAKKGSRTASPAKESVCWQSLRTRSQDTTEGSSSSSDTMISLLRELKGMKLV